jgi:hypothetical protein
MPDNEQIDWRAISERQQHEARLRRKRKLFWYIFWGVALVSIIGAALRWAL